MSRLSSGRKKLRLLRNPSRQVWKQSTTEPNQWLMNHMVSPRSVAFKDTETTSRASISFFIYKVSRLRPLGMVGFEPTTQIPLTAELHPYENHHRSLPFRAGEDEGIWTLDSQIKSLLLYQLSYISELIVSDKHRGEKMLECTQYVCCSRINYWHFLFSLHNRTYHLILFRITHLVATTPRLSYSHRRYNYLRDWSGNSQPCNHRITGSSTSHASYRL